MGARLAGQRVCAVDRHRHSRRNPAAATLQEFLDDLRRVGVADVVDPFVMTSEEAAAQITGPVELLFIDGDHSYEGGAARCGPVAAAPGRGGTVMFHHGLHGSAPSR